MAIPRLPMPEPPVDYQLKKKKENAAKSGGGGGSRFARSILDQMKAMAGGAMDTISDALSKEKADAEAKVQASLFAPDPLMQLQEQLFSGVNSINVPTTPIEQLRKIAEQQVAAQFDPQINALMAEMGSTGTRANRNQQTARDMYGALSKDYLAQLPGITQQYAAEDAAANQRYDQGQQALNTEYQKNVDAQNAVLQQLGIQAAMPDASQQSMEDQAYFQNQMEAEQQSALNQLAAQQMSQQDYTRNLGNNAKMTGENIAQDIGFQLEDYLSQAGSQLRGLQTQRGSTIEALLAQLQQQDAQRAQEQQQQQFDNMLKLYNFQLDATNSMNRNRPSPGSSGFGSGEGLTGVTSGLQGAANYLSSVYPERPMFTSGLMGMLNNVLSNEDVVRGKFVLDPGNESLGQAPKYSDVGQEYMMDLLRREFEQSDGRYSNQDLNATMNALLAYLGKLR